MSKIEKPMVSVSKTFILSEGMEVEVYTKKKEELVDKGIIVNMSDKNDEENIISIYSIKSKVLETYDLNDKYKVQIKSKPRSLDGYILEDKRKVLDKEAELYRVMNRKSREKLEEKKEQLSKLLYEVNREINLQNVCYKKIVEIENKIEDLSEGSFYYQRGLGRAGGILPTYKIVKEDLDEHK